MPLQCGTHKEKFFRSHFGSSVGLKEKFFPLGIIFGYELQATDLNSSICRHIFSSSCFGAARASCKRPRADVDGGGASRAASRGPGPPT